jgi:hypothetical protein
MACRFQVWDAASEVRCLATAYVEASLPPLDKEAALVDMRLELGGTTLSLPIGARGVLPIAVGFMRLSDALDEEGFTNFHSV